MMLYTGLCNTVYVHSISLLFCLIRTFQLYKSRVFWTEFHLALFLSWLIIIVFAFLLPAGKYDSRIRVILHSWATELFGLTVEHFEMLEDTVIVQVKRASGYTKTPK